jgi:hypothetical protein
VFDSKESGTDADCIDVLVAGEGRAGIDRRGILILACSSCGSGAYLTSANGRASFDGIPRPLRVLVLGRHVVHATEHSSLHDFDP